MKRLYILLLLFAVTSVAQAQDDYRPLVREGVRWINFSLDNEWKYEFYSYEFCGDTIIFQDQFSTRFRYKKLLKKDLFSVNFDIITDKIASIEFASTGNSSFCGLYREADKKIYIPGTPSYDGNYTLEDYAFGYPIYNFSNRDTAYVSVFFSGSECAPMFFSNTVNIDGVDSRRYITAPQGRLIGAVIEGVGYDGIYGDLITPNPLIILPTCPCDFGLVCLEDSDGKVLYKGSGYGLYMNFLRTICDFTGDGKVDVSDLSAAIDAAVGKTENGKADVNCDGRVDIADVNTVVNVILNARK